MLSLITIQSLLLIHRLPLHLLRHYRIFRSEIYCPILTLSSTMPSVSSTMPSVLEILHWSIMGLQRFFLVTYIHIVAIIALIPFDITRSQAKPLDFCCHPQCPAVGGDRFALVDFITILFEILAAPWHPKMQCIIRTIVVYWDIWVSASEHRLLKRHFGGQIVKKNSIVNTCCFCADDLGRHWVLRLLNLTFHCNKSVLIHPLLVALR